MKHFILVIIASSMVLLFASCEKEKSGATDAHFEAPYVLTVSLNHSTVNLDTDTTGSVTSLGNNSYRISITVDGRALSGASAPPWTGSIKIYKPGESSSFSSHSILLEGSDTLTFSSTISFNVKRADFGSFRIECAIQAGSGQTSGSINTTLFVTRQNSKPIITAIAAPDTIVRPTGAGYQLLFFAATVSDSDGYSDIQNVFLKRIAPTETGNIYLFDDGLTSLDGDEIAGDGVFSRILSIDSTARLGNQVFLFEATDKSGAFSDSTTHTITIIQHP
jgi:hypothetical protein